MSTQKETVEFILEKLGEPTRLHQLCLKHCGQEHFAVRAMFGEYALYASPKATAYSGAPPKAVVVGLICNDQLYVKILPQSAELEDICEKDEAYPGSKLYYVVEEVQLSKIKNLPDILLDIAKSLPVPKKKKKLTKKAR